MPNNTLSSRILIGAIIPLLLLPFLVFLCIMEGTVDLSLQEVWAAITDKSIETTSAFIVQDIRIPQIITAILAGLALSVSGLLMQTLFANPLADPSLLGVNSGAGLGVALVILCFGGSITLGGTELSGFFLIIGASFVGAGAVILLLMLCHAWLPGKLLLLITGVMISFIAGAMISILNFIASAEGIQTFVLWGMGSYSMVNKALLLPFFLIVLIGIVLALLLIKPLDTLLLGDKYAANLGVSVRRTYALILFTAGLLTAIVTALCGPIAFIGLAVPHAARLTLRTANHRFLIPATMLWGANFSLFCHWLAQIPSANGTLPINTITPLLGVPMCLYILLKRRLT